MTDSSFELILIRASARLPEPTWTPGSSLGYATGEKEHRPARLRLTLLIAAVLLLIGSSVLAYHRTDCGLRNTEIGATWDKTHYRVSGIRFVLPEELAGIPYTKDVVMSLVPHETPFTQALFSPRYRYVSVTYGQERNISVSVGPAAGPYWQHVFSYTGTEPAAAFPPTEETLYRGYRIFSFHEDAQSRVSWLHNGIYYSVTVWQVSDHSTVALNCAQEIIDLNCG